MHYMISYYSLHIYRLDYSFKSHPPVFTTGSFAYIQRFDSNLIDWCYTTCFLCKFVREWYQDTCTIFILSEYNFTPDTLTTGGTPCHYIEVPTYMTSYLCSHSLSRFAPIETIVRLVETFPLIPYACRHLIHWQPRGPLVRISTFLQF